MPRLNSLSKGMYYGLWKPIWYPHPIRTFGICLELDEHMPCARLGRKIFEIKVIIIIITRVSVYLKAMHCQNDMNYLTHCLLIIFANSMGPDQVQQNWDFFMLFFSFVDIFQINFFEKNL